MSVRPTAEDKWAFIQYLNEKVMALETRVAALEGKNDLRYEDISPAPVALRRVREGVNNEKRKARDSKSGRKV